MKINRFSVLVGILATAIGSAHANGITHMPPPFSSGTSVDSHQADGRSCAELEAEMRQVLPDTYYHRPGFAEDPLTVPAFWVGVVAYPAWGYFAYKHYGDQLEAVAVKGAEDKVAALQEAKAQQRCFQAY